MVFKLMSSFMILSIRGLHTKIKIKNIVNKASVLQKYDFIIVCKKIRIRNLYLIDIIR